VAEAITTVHSSVIAVPRIFVNVVFIEYEPTAYFTAGRPNTVSSITRQSVPDSTTRCEANS
jgi:phenylpyruvate tautomerase PptA (4-oxalocrotonate tautomerase family)